MLFPLVRGRLFLHFKGKNADGKYDKGFAFKGQGQDKGKTYDAAVLLTDRVDKNGNKKVGFNMEFDNSKKK